MEESYERNKTTPEIVNDLLDYRNCRDPAL